MDRKIIEACGWGLHVTMSLSVRLFRLKENIDWPAATTNFGESTMTKLINNKFINKVKKFLKSEDGPTAVEYAVMLALIVIVCLTAIQSIGTNANLAFQKVGTQLQTAAS